MEAHDRAFTPDQVSALVAMIERLSAECSGRCPAAHVALVVATTGARLAERGIGAELVDATEAMVRGLLHEPGTAGPQLPVAV